MAATLIAARFLFSKTSPLLEPVSFLEPVPFSPFPRCTVKSPSQSAMDSLLNRGRAQRKPLVVAGCVPQGDQGLKELDDVSIVGVQQIDRVVEIVEETLKGNRVRLLARGALPALDLPKVGLGLDLGLKFGLRFAVSFDLSSTSVQVCGRFCGL
jgi:hypothetical protein